MNLAYTLNKNLDPNKIFKDLNKLLQKVSREDAENLVLTISLQKVESMPPPNLPDTISSNTTLSQPN